MRKIEGDVNLLKSDLQAALGVKEGDVTVNQLARQVIVKVRYDFLLFPFLEWWWERVVEDRREWILGLGLVVVRFCTCAGRV